MRRSATANFFRKACEDARETALHVQRPVRGNAAELRQKVLIALDGPGDHGRKKQDEGHVLADGAGFGLVAVAVPGVVEKFKRKEGYSERQKRVSPVKRILAGHGPNQPGKKIAIFEDAEKQYGLRNAEPAKPGSGLVKAADERFPQKNKQAGRADRSAQLGVREINEEEATAEDNDPWPHALTGNAEKDRGGEKKEKVIVPGVENHGTRRAAFSALQHLWRRQGWPSLTNRWQ